MKTFSYMLIILALLIVGCITQTNSGNSTGSSSNTSSSSSVLAGTPNPADKPDGWASYGAPVNPGGYQADPDNIYTVAQQDRAFNCPEQRKQYSENHLYKRYHRPVR